MDTLTTFADGRESERIVGRLDTKGVAFGVVLPDPAGGRVARPALAMREEAEFAFLAGPGTGVLTSGGVDDRRAAARPSRDAARRCPARDVPRRGRPAAREARVESTNACDLSSTTSVRHARDEPEGFVEWSVFGAVADGLTTEPPGRGGDAPTVACVGLGEPLLHPRFLDMVRLAKGPGAARRGHCDCELVARNQEDCFGDPHPVCGDCLWARGVIRCA